MTLLRPDGQSPLSPHLGIGTWLLVYDPRTDGKTFDRNALLMGKGVVDIFVQHRFMDVMFSSIGHGALKILRAAGIRALDGPPDELIDRLG
jgi:predicted Fe-Mo cluster-binding NifX family protein